MGLPRFGVHQNSYEALKKFNHGGAYLGRGWIVTLLRSTIGALVESASAITPHQTDHERALSMRAVLKDSAMRRVRRAAPSQFAAPSAGLRRPPRGCDGLRCPYGR